MTRLRALAVFAILGGLVAWSSHLWLVYSLGDYPCRPGAGGRVLGIEVAVWWYALSVVAGVLAVAAVVAGVYVARRRTHVQAGSQAEPEVREAALRWLGLIGAGVSLLFLASIVLGGLAPLMVPCT